MKLICVLATLFLISCHRNSSEVVMRVTSLGADSILVDDRRHDLRVFRVVVAEETRWFPLLLFKDPQDFDYLQGIRTSGTNLICYGKRFSAARNQQKLLVIERERSTIEISESSLDSVAFESLWAILQNQSCSKESAERIAAILDQTRRASPNERGKNP